MATATCGLYLSNGNGTHWTWTLTYNATTGAPLSLVVTNTSPTAVATVHLTITIAGVVTPKTYLAAVGHTAPNAIAFSEAMSALGLTNVLTQLKGVGGGSV